MYRPLGWNKLDKHPCAGDGCLECRDVYNYERGADDMLGGLALAGSIRTKGNDLTVLIELPNIHNGTWVFVPDDD